MQPGTGTGTGTEGDPYYFSQLATAEAAAGAGGAILFEDGTYAGNIGSGSVDNLIYKAINTKVPVLTGPTSGGPTGANHFYSSGSLTKNVEGFTVELSNYINYAARTKGQTNFTQCHIDSVRGFNAHSVDSPGPCLFQECTFSVSSAITLFGTGLTTDHFVLVNCSVETDQTTSLGECAATDSIFSCTNGSANTTPDANIDSASSNNWFYNFANITTADAYCIGTTDPLFEKTVGNRYFVLRPDSPCIGKGSS